MVRHRLVQKTIWRKILEGFRNPERLAYTLAYTCHHSLEERRFLVMSRLSFHFSCVCLYYSFGIWNVGLCWLIEPFFIFIWKTLSPTVTMPFKLERSIHAVSVFFHLHSSWFEIITTLAQSYPSSVFLDLASFIKTLHLFGSVWSWNWSVLDCCLSLVRFVPFEDVSCVDILVLALYIYPMSLVAKFWSGCHLMVSLPR